MNPKLQLAAAMVLASCANLLAQEKTEPSIATVDVSYIFKNYKPVAEKLIPLRADVQELEKTIQLRQLEIDTIQRKLQTGGGEDRDKLQLQFAKLSTELRLFVEKERQTLTRRELAIQTMVYKEVQAEVAKIAKERGLKLVIVRPRGSLESQDLSEVNRTLNQLVIYEDGLDISDEVLKAMEAKEPSDVKDDDKEKDKESDK